MKRVIVALVAIAVLFLAVFFHMAKQESGESVNFTQTECLFDIMPYEKVECNTTTRVLTAFITVPGCDVQFSVKKKGGRYLVYEVACNRYCKCLCTKKVTIYNASDNSEVVLVRGDKSRVIGRCRFYQ